MTQDPPPGTLTRVGAHCSLSSPGSLGAWQVPGTLGAPDGWGSEPSAQQGPSRKHQPPDQTSHVQDLKRTLVGLRPGAWRGGVGGQRLEVIGNFSRCHRGQLS